MTEVLETPVKSVEEVPVGEERPTYTEWVKQVMEGLLEAEKKWFELASDQNALTLKAIRQGVELYRTAPTLPTAGWARRGMENFLEVQTKWLDSAIRQRNELLRQSQEGAAETEVVEEVHEGDGVAAVRRLPDFVRQQLENLIEARKRWLDFAEQQNTQFVQGLREALGIRETSTTAGFAKWSQQMMENYFEVQKRWLDLVTRVPGGRHPEGEA
jgi:hypothetical protein